jgi:uridine phosphorylase
LAGGSEIIVNARRSGFEAEVKGPVIFCPVGAYLSIAARLLRAKRLKRPLIPGKVYMIKRKQGYVTLFGPGQGAPMAVMALERCAAQGCRHFILLGVCGSLRKDVKIGDFIIATSGLSEEGTSAHYEPKKNLPEAGDMVTEALRRSLKESDESFHEGRVWTTDAIYRETCEKVINYGGQGLLGVEMEASAIFTAGRFLGVHTGALLVVSDELAELKWRPGFASPRFLNSLRKAAKISLQAALSLHDIES